MFIPWEVDAPYERVTWMNWLIMAATTVVFVFQGYAAFIDADPHAGITGLLLLDGWHAKGLFGHMWLHADLYHLLGNMLFLWVFGNAVCATLGNIRYAFLYVFWGLCAASAHLMTSEFPALGASGAINGIVGMFLFLYPKNQITCYFFFWLMRIHTYSFMLPSYALILFWLFWDVYGALRGHGGIAYTAHLGGFAAGFLCAFVLCKLGWVTLWEREESLLDLWHKIRHSGPNQATPPTADQQDDPLAELAPRRDPAPSLATPEPLAFTDLGNRDKALFGDPSQDVIRYACACGQRIKVPPALAGRSILCSKCQAAVHIPSSQDSSRARIKRRTLTNVIRFTCTCGKPIKVPAKYAGKTGTCPKCSALVRVPSMDVPR
jgi:membrane associated rhomboid family serine protease